MFRKAVLKVGTYHSPDGVVEVTPDRLRHWEKQVKKIQATGYAIPMHWDHSSEMELLEPIKLTTLQENKNRSAQNTVGRLLDFEVSPKGDSAVIRVEGRTTQAKEAMQSNAVFVSPVLFSEWKDGSGQTYTDTIGSIDLVDYPVDYAQGPFEPVQTTETKTQSMRCCIRMSSKPKTVYRMAMPYEEEDKEESEKDESSVDPATEPAMDSTMGESEAEFKPANPAATSVSDVVQSLTQVGIVLPDDTTTANFLERLRPALLTAIASKQQPQQEMPATELPPEQQPEQPVLADQPQIAAMSARIRQLEQERINDKKTVAQQRLDSLLKSGRITPHEFQKLKSDLSVQRMSVTKDGSVDTGKIGVWIESREQLPKGAVWDASQRIERLGLYKVDAPESFTTRNGITKKQEDEAVKALLGKSL